MKISNFLKLDIDYHLTMFQISWLSGSNFAIVFGNDVIMTSFVTVELSILHIFVEHNISYQPCKFQLFRMSGSNFTEGGGNTP